MNRILAVLIGLLAAMALLSCASLGSSQSLADSLWILTELNGSAPVPGTTLSAQFNEDGRVSGSSGCNNYNTIYEASGDNLTFGGPVGMTLMACPEPIMAQEQEYLQALSDTATFEIRDDTLTLFDADGNERAVFAAQSQDLAGSSWEVIAYNNGKGGVVSVIIGTEITANFSEDDQLTGNASCNDYTAAYETDSDSISIGPAAVTRMFCAEPEGVMEQESQYLAALETAATYKIEGNSMEMRTAEGSMVATFSRPAGP